MQASVYSTSYNVLEYNNRTILKVLKEDTTSRVQLLER